MSVASKYSIKQSDSFVTVLRSAQTGSFEGNGIEVATAYVGSEDRYATHVYITAADGVRRKLPMSENLADSEREGLGKGWAAVEAFFQS